MATAPEDDLLLKFEQENLPPHYKDYYVTKRQNFLASIQGFRPLWQCFMLLDEIWFREFEDMRVTRNIHKMFPLILFMNAHAKMRIALELGLSACLAEAYSILRDAIESVAHGHKLLSDPALLHVWLNKINDEAGLKAFEKDFWHYKEERLFDGLPNLYGWWKRYSEFGSHTNINSVTPRFNEESASTVEWKLNYTGLKPEIWAPALFEMLLTFHAMEDVLFKDCEDRLKFDVELGRMRANFQRDEELVRKQIIVSFKIPRPSSQTASQ